ncbi:biosynthetic peptidoglycan transglycosylase [Mucilaginibacter sp. BT774]|uniref:biosynthetic peptidoglycan transglycosylase n=1 Tax=Mucilaginibacter sp. BT774 TaxID=3062276 RepID=UPI00267566A7|nr:biosynthetic peptidoglycan transglycosylase [Mucilaginibacter sp. BT774]MDO3628418.1 biosynthetic peptidoglycan transglycosylase [Mucilaginibacter sp. BT774]
MHRPISKYIRIAGIVAISLIILLLIGGYIAYNKREALLQKEIAKAKDKAKKDYKLNINIGAAHFTGLSTVSFSDITVVPDQRDSLLSIKKFDISIKIIPLIFGNVKFADIVLDNGHLNLTDVKGVKNFDFLFKKKDTTEKKERADLSVLANNLVKQVLYKIPDDLDLRNFLVTFKKDSAGIKLLAQSAVIKDGKLSSTIKVNDTLATWHIGGKMQPSDKNIDIHLYADGKKVEIPYVEERYHLKVNFDTISTRLEKVENSDGVTRIYGSWSVKNLLVNHPALSPSDILVPDGSIDANVFVGKNYVSLDSSSLIKIKKIAVKTYLKYQLYPVKIYTVKVNSDWMNAQDVFDSFPQGMFDSFDGIQVTGKVKYHLHVFLDSSNPDQVQFESALAKDNLNIVKYGKTDLGRLNRPFVYTPYEKGKPMPSRIIGPQNPDFTPLEDVSPNLKYAVMTSEDPSFYTNHGFVEESIRRSIATDIKQKKFKRGGSTISMQLIKNAFLSREKTLSRKIEEILIVWMIENNNVMSKDRMLEVYFNIVEWGRNIYGIGEASRYYFGKSPSNLTLGEGIYLASILPHPKTGLYSFLPDGSLRPSLINYYNLIGKMMAARKWTDPDSSGYGYYSVRLREDLRQNIAPVSTAVADSLMKQTNDDDDDVNVQAIMNKPTVPEKKPNFFQRLFGKKDTTVRKSVEQEPEIDTVGKTKKQIRQEKRALRRLEKQRQKELRDKGLM